MQKNNKAALVAIESGYTYVHLMRMLMFLAKYSLKSTFQESLMQFMMTNAAFFYLIRGGSELCVGENCLAQHIPAHNKPHHQASTNKYTFFAQRATCLQGTALCAQLHTTTYKCVARTVYTLIH